MGFAEAVNVPVLISVEVVPALSREEFTSFNHVEPTLPPVILFCANTVPWLVRITLLEMLIIGAMVSELPLIIVLAFDSVMVPDPVIEPVPETKAPLPPQVELVAP